KSLVICIKDTGIGLNKSDQLDIFEQFYVVGDISYHRSSKTAFGGGGMGLGLPIAQGIIKAHQGKIWVESDGLGQGSIFYILLPYRRKNDES
ncbi:ATP-binding protein, partial [Anaerolineales bacterium HSG25]|nr:ATP-binding protein [Anaerolineales bacterium HSG25]